MTLDEYMAYPWTPVYKRHPEGGWCLTVPNLDDFELFGSKKLLEAEWRDALRGHLSAYLKNQKQIPIPRFSVEERVAGPRRAPGQVFMVSSDLSQVREVRTDKKVVSDETTKDSATWPILVPRENGRGALNSGGTPGNKGGGRPKLAFKNFVAQMRSDPQVQQALEDALKDPKSKNYAAALRVIVDYDDELPANLTAEQRKARVLELVKEAQQREKRA